MQACKSDTFVGKSRLNRKFLLSITILFPFLTGAYYGESYVRGKYRWDSILFEPATKEERVLNMALNIDQRIYMKASIEIQYGGGSFVTTFPEQPEFVNAGTRFEKDICIPEAAYEEEGLYIRYNAEFLMSYNIEDYAGLPFSFYLNRIRPRTLTYKDFPFSRERIDGTCAYFVEENDYHYEISKRYFEFDGSGFKEEYECDKSGAIPLWDMKFMQRDYLDYKTPINPKSAELRIYDYIDDFRIGTIFNPPGASRYLSIPLGVKKAKEYSYLCSKNPLKIKKDFRYETSGTVRNEDEWNETTTIYLPPNKGGETRKYNCEIVLDGVGEMNQDNFRHEFLVYRYSNYIGGKVNSDYYVSEVEV